MSSWKLKDRTGDMNTLVCAVWEERNEPEVDVDEDADEVADARDVGLVGVVAGAGFWSAGALGG